MISNRSTFNPAVKQHLYNINRYKDGLAPATLINVSIRSRLFEKKNSYELLEQRAKYQTCLSNAELRQKCMANVV